MPERYTLKMKSGRRVKVKQLHVYCIDIFGLRIDLQELPKSGGGGCRTHIWINGVEDEEMPLNIYEYVVYGCHKYPWRTVSQALQFSWYLDENDDFVGPTAVYELVIKRKLSQTLVNGLKAWLAMIMEVLLHHIGMRSLFGEDVAL